VADSAEIDLKTAGRILVLIFADDKEGGFISAQPGMPAAQREAWFGALVFRMCSRNR